MEEHEKELERRLQNILEKTDIAAKQKELKDLEALTYDQQFWKDSQKAAEVSKRIDFLKKEIEDLEILKLHAEENAYEAVEELIKKYETLLFLSGEYDKGNTIFAIHSGQGGTEAMDWAEILLRMYTRYFERKGWKFEEIDRVPGEEAGIKSVTLNIYGPYSFGYLKAEAGVHRLVRQSPFNANALRQTSFALVEVLPMIEDKVFEVKEDDLEWQFFRAGGHGGQNVNKVSTAVRLTHRPSGLVVTSQTERQQGQNREIALKLLRAKLWQIEEAKRQEKMAGMKTDKIASWGLQIRSYVLHPYKLIKDLRTNYESNQPDVVLAGDLDGFIEAYLKSKA